MTQALSFRNNPRMRVLSKEELTMVRKAIELDEDDRVQAITSELHPDHWPAWMRLLADRMKDDSIFCSSSSGPATTGRIVGCVAQARCFEDSPDGRAARKQYAELVRSCSSQRQSILSAMHDVGDVGW